MAHALVDPVGAASGSGLDALHDRTVRRVAFGNVQVCPVHSLEFRVGGSYY